MRDQRTCTDDQWISEGDLRFCDHRDHDFSGMNLSGTEMTDAVLLGATFTGAVLTKADSHLRESAPGYALPLRG